MDVFYFTVVIECFSKSIDLEDFIAFTFESFANLIVIAANKNHYSIFKDNVSDILLYELIFEFNG